MEYRGVEYTVVQGIERGVWKWSASVEGIVVMGNEQTRPAAVIAAEKAIDRVLSARTAPPLQPWSSSKPRSRWRRDAHPASRHRSVGLQGHGAA
jgi:hypothetical protein